MIMILVVLLILKHLMCGVMANSLQELNNRLLLILVVVCLVLIMSMNAVIYFINLNIDN